MKNVASWFAIPATDIERAMKFYSAIFDIEFHVEEMKDGPNAFFPMTEAGGVGGHIFADPKFKPSDEGPLIYLNGGDDLNEVLHKVESAGGTIHTPKQLVADEIGYIGIFIDTEGNRLALHSPY